jgi:hypothetical protein
MVYFRRIFSQIPLSASEQAALFSASFGFPTNIAPRIRHGAQVLVRRDNLIQSKFLLPLHGTSEYFLHKSFETKYTYELIDSIIQVDVKECIPYTHLLTGFTDGGIVKGRAMIPPDVRTHDILLL